MKTYQDENIKLKLPNSWNIHFFEIEDRIIYTLVGPPMQNGTNLTLSINIEPGNPYLGQMDKSELIKVFNEEPMVDQHEIEFCGLLENSQNQQFFYLVQKPIDHLNTLYKLSFYMPYNKANSKKIIISSYNMIERDIYLYGREKLMEIVESIELSEY